MSEAWHTSAESLYNHGFRGFVTIRDLRDCNLKPVPGTSGDVGVYLVLMPDDKTPAFLPRSTGGWHKGNDPNVNRADLAAKWIRGTRIVYVGKAGPSPDRTLKERIGEYLAFGTGKRIGHWGGRYLWHLPESEKLIVCWKTTPAENPREVEKRMIREFEGTFGAIPFANLNH